MSLRARFIPRAIVGIVEVFEKALGLETRITGGVPKAASARRIII
jgi:hypothetical protein